jgi:flavin reductase (DIM6/NTAB) family NADH-FMN oxidoreductase RutF
MPTIEPEHFKEVMRCWVAGVAIVTTRLGEQVHGMTANSFASVSLTPPLISISFAKTSHTYQMIKESRIFAINILSEQMQAASERFAGHLIEQHGHFQDEPYHVEVTGAPILDRAIAFCDCRVFSDHDVGLNIILIGLVEAGRVLNHDKPLIYTNRQYRRLAD